MLPKFIIWKTEKVSLVKNPNVKRSWSSSGVQAREGVVRRGTNVAVESELRNLIRGTACIRSFQTIAPRGERNKKSSRHAFSFGFPFLNSF